MKRQIEYLKKIKEESSDLLKDCCLHDLPRAVQTGYSNDLINSFERGTLTIVSAVPSMGKSSFVINIAKKTALNNKTAMIFSGELSKHEILSRLLSSEAKVEHAKLASGQITQEEWPQVETASQKLSETNIFIDDTHFISSSELLEKCLSVKSEENGLDLVIIDSIDMLRLNGVEERLDKASVLKKIARQLDVPIIVTSCIHRETGIQKRKDKTPIWSDLPHDIFGHVDTIIFLHREYYYDLNTDENKLNIICPKGFPSGSAQLEWQSAFLAVEDI